MLTFSSSEADLLCTLGKSVLPLFSLSTALYDSSGQGAQGLNLLFDFPLCERTFFSQ